MRSLVRGRGAAGAAVVPVVLLLASCADDSDRRGSEAATAAMSVTSPAGLAVTTDAAVTTDVAVTQAPPSDDAAAAIAICAALRDQANVMTDVANSTARGVGEQTPRERYETLFGGFDRGAEASRAFADSLDELDVPAIPERDDLIAQLRAGADAAAAEFVDEQGRFAEAVGGAVSDADWQGRVGELFNSIEKANSIVEPVIARYERTELKRAFLDEPACRYVIQPFVLDESGGEAVSRGESR